MNQQLCYFFPHNPIPPISGAHLRCLEMLSCLKEMGFDTIFLSSNHSSETNWNYKSIKALKSKWVMDVRIHEISKTDKLFVKIQTQINNILGFYVPLNSRNHTPPGMQRWFRKAIERNLPDVILMNYAIWDGLIDHKKGPSLSIIDIHDLLSVQNHMRRAIYKYIPNSSKLDIEKIDDELIELDFFIKHQIKPDPLEFDIYDQYDHTITISKIEESFIRDRTNNTRVHLIEMMLEPNKLNNDYSSAPIFPTGPNPFNVQGYIFFVKKVLPLILKSVPKFKLQVTGYIGNSIQVSPPEGVEIRGFIHDLNHLYSSAKFLINPVLGGTGQQVKIIESMANGLPVIALENTASNSPIIHEVNGYIAKDEYEFAEYSIRLWNNQALCRKLGTAARETIRTNYSRKQLLERMTEIFSPYSNTNQQ